MIIIINWAYNDNQHQFKLPFLGLFIKKISIFRTDQKSINSIFSLKAKNSILFYSFFISSKRAEKTTKEVDIMKVAVEEWELYNNGILLCKWVDLEVDDYEDIIEYIKGAKKANNLNYKDIEDFIADTDEDELNIIENECSLSDAYEKQETLNNIESYDIKKIGFMINMQGYDLDQAINKVDNCDHYENMTFNDLADEFIQEGVFGEDVMRLYENNYNWLDIDAIARDLQYDYTEYNGDIFRCD